MYSRRFQKHLYDESALSLSSEVLIKPLHKSNEDRPYYATQHQNIFVQYQKILTLSQAKHQPNLTMYT